YADDISERAAAKRATPTKGSAGNVADVISDSPTRRGINIFANKESPVVAVNDGVIEDVGKNKKLGRYVVLRDAYGNEFTYAGLGSISDVVPVPKERKLSAKDFDLITPGEGDHKPTVEASDTGQADAAGASSESESADRKKVADGQPAAPDRAGPANTEDSRDRLYALPRRSANIDRADLTGQLDAVLGKGMPGYETFKSYFSGVLRFDDSKMDTEPLRKGSHVAAGTILGRVAPSEDGVASHLNFAITPAGRGAHTIDPKPILDGWKLLEATAIYRAAGKDPFDNEATVGQVLLASKAQLQEQVLNDPNLEIYSCGRDDIQTGLIDRRILATMEYLVQRGFRLTITSLECGHGVYTSSGNVSEHTTGDAMDIALVNGIPILGNQGTGSITEAVINELLKLQGPMQPHQIISLMQMGGPTYAMGDHDDHIHVGFTPDATASGQPLGGGLLKPDQWDKLLKRIGELDQPTVPTKPSKYSLPAGNGKRASSAHIGE
ncbi:MAG: peptidoglycan DD-metalloendopeptidase family protein, partial [Solirubrobacterales bacterium]|nr:peptidoglycan DD-metalloendopeptidase family protein [Solirubrobacterales bacterium]